MSSNKLIEIPQSDWEKLRDLYVNHKNRSSSYSTIQNFIDWINQDPLIEDLNIYSLNGDWESDGTFILKWQHIICCNTLNNENHENLIAALNCLEKNSTYLYSSVVERLLPVVKNHLENYCSHYNIDATAWYYISKEKIQQMKLQPPPGITLNSLNESHTNTVNNIWPHKTPGSEKFIRMLIKYNTNVGAFKEDGTLIAWCLRLPFGSLGALQVIEEYKRKGLGQLIVQAMAKKIFSLGHEVMAPVVVKNIASRNMFEKLGFEVIDHVYWLTKS